MPLRLLVLSLLATGCATSLGATHTARTLPKGKFEVTAHAGILAPIGVIKEALDAGEKVAEQMAPGGSGTVEVDPETLKALTVAAAAVIAGPPSPVTEFSLRYGLLERVEVGGRYSGPALRLESHVQLAKDGPLDVVGGIGVARHTFDGGLLGLLGKLKLAEFKRTDLDIVVLAGRENEYGAFWFGPKAVYSAYASEGLAFDDRALALAGGVDPGIDLGSSLLVGGVIGARLGFKHVWLSAELGIYGSRYSPTVLNETVDLGGLVVYPTIGIATRN